MSGVILYSGRKDTLKLIGLPHIIVLTLFLYLQ